MRHSTFILALAGLSTANLTGHLARKTSPTNPLPKPRDVSVSCTTLEVECDGSCIPFGSECCADGNGSFCDAGRYCQANGCCEDGEICNDELPTGCDDDLKLCGSLYCVPEDAVCCDGSSYCEAGQTCTSDGLCDTGLSVNNLVTSSVTSSATSSVTTSATISTAMAAPTNQSNLCARGRKGKGGGGGDQSGGDEEEEDESSGGGGGGSGGDGCGSVSAAGGFAIPTLFAAVIVAFASF